VTRLRTRPRGHPPYNPALHGLPAKAWECLRRNQEFRDVIKAARASREEIPDEVLIAIYETSTSASKAASFLLHRCGQPFDLGRPWPDFPLSLKKEFENLFSTKRKYSFGDDFASFSGGGSLPYVVDSIPEGADIISPVGHTLVAIPNHIRDPRHRAAVIQSLSKLVSQPSTRDVRTAANNGRILGSESEWRGFLLVEQWQTSAGFMPGKAANLAAWELYGDAPFGDRAEARAKAAEHFLSEHPKSHKRRSKVLEQVKAIETAIKSVYPSFTPFEAANANAP
jgi:hypothetical protein